MACLLCIWPQTLPRVCEMEEGVEELVDGRRRGYIGPISKEGRPQNSFKRNCNAKMLECFAVLVVLGLSGNSICAMIL